MHLSLVSSAWDCLSFVAAVGAVEPNLAGAEAPSAVKRDIGIARKGAALHIVGADRVAVDRAAPGDHTGKPGIEVDNLHMRDQQEHKPVAPGKAASAAEPLVEVDLASSVADSPLVVVGMAHVALHTEHCDQPGHL